MRGLIVGETSELDAIIEEHLKEYLKPEFLKKIDLEAFLRIEIINNLEKRKLKIEEQYKNNGLESIFPFLDAVKKWQLLREILKVNKEHKSFISEFIAVNSTYQNEVIEIRNKFAHSMVIINNEGKEVLKALIGDKHYEFDDDSFKKIREDLIKHRKVLLKLKE